MASGAKKRVFISYARTPADQQAARWLARNLRTARGIERVFFDEETLVQASELRQSLAGEIRSSDAVVFLVSQSWIDRDHTRQELLDTAAADRTGQVILRIPVFRQPRESLAVLPAEFSRFASSIEWIASTDPHKLLWQVYCAIMGEETGSREEWHQNGVTISDPTAELPDQGGDDPVTDRPSLECGRDSEWGYVSGDPVSRHRLIIIGGARGEDHGHFVKRIERCLASVPLRSMSYVEWGTGSSADARPQHKDDYLECFGRALTKDRRTLDRPDLISVLRARLADRNLIAIHPKIDSFFEDEYLVAYYREWLPELLAEVKPRMRLKCVQPVAWSGAAVRRIAARIVSRRPFTTALEWLSRGEERLARRLVRALRGGAASHAHDISPLLAVELWPVVDEDVEVFCERKAIEGMERDEMLQLAVRADTSEKKFAAIDRYLIASRRAQTEGRRP